MVSFDNFQYLDPEARDLFNDLMLSAGQQQSPFLSFIFLWMAFNGWIASITGADTDARMIAAIASNVRLNDEYRSLLRKEPAFAQRVVNFASLWPVFDARDAKAKLRQQAGSRNYLAAAHRAGVKHQPRNWRSDAQPTWDQLIRTIYLVRCNLFHGRKSPQNGRDHQLVLHSLGVLADFLDRSGCTGWYDS